MKHFRLAFMLAVCLPVGAFCQFTKGTLVPGFSLGSVFFQSGKTDYGASPPTTGYTSSTNSLGFNLSPSLGRFINQKTLLGVRLISGFQYDKYLDAVNNVTFRKKEDRVSQWGLGFFARNYLSQAGKNLPFIQLNLDAGIGSSRTEGFNYTSTYRETYVGKSKGNFFANAGAQMGMTRMLSTQVGLDVSAGYLFSYQKETTRTETNRDINIDGSIDEQLISEISAKSKNHGFTLQVGIVVFLKK